MLRNLRTARFLGTPFRGVKGKNIPSTGDHGASVMYNDIDPVAEAEDEFSFRITSKPANLFMYEDGGIVFPPPNDGTYTVTGVLVKNGADVGPETITLQSGVAGVTISCSAGLAAAGGVTATIRSDRTISCSLGGAAASGAPAAIRSDRTLSCAAGTAAAGGAQATITTSAIVPVTVAASSVPLSHVVKFGGGTRVVQFAGSAKTVSFGGSLKRVAFAGGVRTVRFSGGTRVVKFT